VTDRHVGRCLPEAGRPAVRRDFVMQVIHQALLGGSQLVRHGFSPGDYSNGAGRRLSVFHAYFNQHNVNVNVNLLLSYCKPYREILIAVYFLQNSQKYFA
jgi:hypothetical protein